YMPRRRCCVLARSRYCVLEARAEVGHVGAAVALAAHRRAAGDAETDLVEAPVQDVRPVGRAVHPGAHDARGRRVVPAAPGDVLADGVAAARAAQVTGAPDAAGEVAVGEVVAPGHVAGVALRCAIEVLVLAQLLQPVGMTPL